MSTYLLNAVFSEAPPLMMRSSCKHMMLLVLICSAVAPAWADEPKASPRPSGVAADREALEVAEALRESWPDRPEWVDMLADILDSKSMGPDYGWFRTAVAQIRFDWAWARQRFDKNGDGRIERPEFAGGDHDFARLDRDRDGRLTAADFDFSGSSLDPTPGALVFDRVDKDGNGKVTREEFDAFFRACDSGGQGFVSLSDLNEASRRRAEPREARAGRRRRPWCAACSARRSARFSRALSSARVRRTFLSRRMMARPRSLSRSWSDRNRSYWSSAISPADRSAATPATLKSCTVNTRTAPLS